VLPREGFRRVIGWAPFAERRVRVRTSGVSGVVGGCDAPRLSTGRRVPAPPGRRSELQRPGHCDAANSRGDAGHDEPAEEFPPVTAGRAEWLRSPGERARCGRRFVVTQFVLDLQTNTSGAPKAHLTADNGPSDVSTLMDDRFGSSRDRFLCRHRATTATGHPPTAGSPKTSLTRSRFMTPN